MKKTILAALFFVAMPVYADEQMNKPSWVQVSSDLASMHYLPGKVAMTSRNSLLWLWPKGTPAGLKNLTPGSAFSPLLLGAMDYFARVNGLPWSNSSLHWDEGKNLTRLYAAVLSAWKQGDTAPKPFVWVRVRKAEPETLRIWKYDPQTNTGRWVLKSLANTGVAGAATPDGTWPVYARFASTQMTGCFPNGECYDDPDVRYVNYFLDGRAVHYYPRARYGFPQSNGCVELPLSAAKKAFALIHVGTPVTVQQG